MTCIVGLVQNDEVWIGSDSRVSFGDSYGYTTSTEKVFTNRFLFGCCGDIRMINLLRYELVVPELDEYDLDRSIVTRLIPAIQKTYKEGGWLIENQGRQQGGQFLLAVGNNLYTVDYNHQIIKPGSGFTAIGSGVEVALGSLYSTAKREPLNRVLTALQAGASFNPYVAAPFHIWRSGSSGISYCGIFNR